MDPKKSILGTSVARTTVTVRRPRARDISVRSAGGADGSAFGMGNAGIRILFSDAGTMETYFERVVYVKAGLGIPTGGLYWLPFYMVSGSPGLLARHDVHAPPPSA